MGYSPALGRLINRKNMIQNKNSEKGYRDISLNINGEAVSTENQIYVKCTNVSSTQFSFPASLAQSTIGGQQGSNACTIIAVKGILHST